MHSNVSELLHIDVFTRRSLYKEWGRKKEGSIRRCVLEVLVQRSLVDLLRICRLFLVLSTRRNCVVYNVLVPLAFKQRLCQHTGNYVNTSVSAIPGPHNTVNTVIFAIRGSKSHLKKSCFALARSQQRLSLRCFLFRDRQQSRKHRLFGAVWKFAQTTSFMIFIGLQTVSTTKRTTRTPTGTSSNKKKSKDDDDDDETCFALQQQLCSHNASSAARCSSQHLMSASSDEIPLSLPLPRPLQA